MADDQILPPSPSPPTPSTPAPSATDDYQEFGSAKRNLPPAAPVAIAILLVAVVIGIVMYLNRAKPIAQGGIDGVFYSQPAEMTSPMILVEVTLRNVSDKTLYIKSIKGAITTDQGDQTDDAAAARDYDRYISAYPDLTGHSRPLLVETKIPPGGEQKGAVLISPGVTKAQFDARKDTIVIIEPYDQRPIELHEKPATGK
jgi:hypothetical protein